MTHTLTETISVKYTEWGEYVYFATFVVSLGERLDQSTPVAVRRVWADDILIYNRETGYTRFPFLFFDGNEGQQEVYNGLHYRGQMTILFEDMALTDFNNRLPSISVELVDGVIVREGEGTINSIEIYDFTHVEMVPETGLLFRAQVKLALSQNYVPNAPVGVMRRYVYLFETVRYDTGAVVASKQYPTTLTFNQEQQRIERFAMCRHGGLVFVQTFEGHRKFLDLNTMKVRAYGPTINEKWDAVISFAHRQTNLIAGLVQADVLDVIAQGVTHAISRTPLPEAPLHMARHKGGILVPMATNGVRWFVFGLGHDGVPVVAHDETLYVPNDGHQIYQVYGLPDGGVLVLVKTDFLVHRGHAVRLAPDTYNVMWETDTFDLPNITSRQELTNETTSDLSAGTVALRINLEDFLVTVIDTLTGEVRTELIIEQEYNWYSTPALWDSRSQTMFGTGNNFTGVGSTNLIDHAIPEIFTALAVRSGMETDEIASHGLDTIVVPGYVMVGEAAMNTLMTFGLYYGFTVTDAAGVVEAIRPYNNDQVVISATLNTDNLATASEGSEDINFFGFSRMPDYMLPRDVGIEYLNRGDDYRPGEYSIGRTTTPLPSNSSNERLSLSASISLTGPEAATIAADVLVRQWASRDQYTVRVPADNITIKPGQAVAIEAYGERHTAIVTNRILNADFSTSLSLMGAATDDYPAVIEPQEPIRVTQPTGEPVEAVLMDVPDRTAADATIASLNVRAALAGYTENTWPGVASLDTKYATDGSPFQSRMVTDEPQLVGKLVVGPEPVQSAFETDYHNRIIIDRGNIPESYFQDATYDEMLAGANLAIIGQGAVLEYIQWGKAEILTGTLVRLSVLFRGRFGTDSMVNMITGGVFVPVDEDPPILTFDITDFQRMRSFVYRGAPALSPVTPPTNKVFFVAGNSRKPHAPTDIRAYLLGDDTIRVEWKRRVRFGQEMRDGTGDVPLDEPTELYSLDIYGPDGEVIRRVLGVPYAQFNYTAAQQLDDGFTGDRITLSVFQVNETHVGRGFPGYADVPLLPYPDPVVNTEIETTAHMDLVVEGLEVHANIDMVAVAAMELDA